MKNTEHAEGRDGDPNEVVLTRVFDAPRRLVMKAM